jgi:hypothetical protein
MTYSLKEGGPVVDTGVKADLPGLTNYCPVLPIVSNSSDLVLKGTAVGNIEVLNVRSRATASLHHCECIVFVLSNMGFTRFI